MVNKAETAAIATAAKKYAAGLNTEFAVIDEIGRKHMEALRLELDGITLGGRTKPQPNMLTALDQVSGERTKGIRAAGKQLVSRASEIPLKQHSEITDAALRAGGENIGFGAAQRADNLIDVAATGDPVKTAKAMKVDAATPVHGTHTLKINSERVRKVTASDTTLLSRGA